MDLKRHIDWIFSHHRQDGGFASKLNTHSRLSDTYYAVRSLKKIDEAELLDKESLLSFVLSCVYEDGGFSNSPEFRTFFKKPP